MFKTTTIMFCNYVFVSTGISHDSKRI